MNDPKRLIHGDDLGAELLGSAFDDVPRPGSRQRAAAALGLAVGAAALTSGGSAGAAGTASIAPKAIGAVAGAGGTAGTTAGAGAVAAKAAGGGILLKIVAGGAVAVKANVSAPSAPMTTVSVPTTQPMSTANRAIPAPEPPKAATEETPSNTDVSPAVSAKTTTTLRSPAAKPTDSATTETQLAKELRALDGARGALNRGDTSGALAELDKHDRAFPTGPLRMEAAVLRAEVLLARGDTARAKRLASDLLARDPNGPFARRLRTIADGP